MSGDNGDTKKQDGPEVKVMVMIGVDSEGKIYINDMFKHGTKFLKNILLDSLRILISAEPDQMKLKSKPSLLNRAKNRLGKGFGG